MRNKATSAPIPTHDKLGTVHTLCLLLHGGPYLLCDAGRGEAFASLWSWLLFSKPCILENLQHSCQLRLRCDRLQVCPTEALCCRCNPIEINTAVCLDLQPCMLWKVSNPGICSMPKPFILQKCPCLTCLPRQQLQTTELCVNNTPDSTEPH